MVTLMDGSTTRICNGLNERHKDMHHKDAEGNFTRFNLLAIIQFT